jgi:PAS domain-containing protein
MYRHAIDGTSAVSPTHQQSLQEQSEDYLGKPCPMGIGRDQTDSTEWGTKYRGLLEAAPDAMVVVNPMGEIVLLNVRAARQFGYTRDELVDER